MSDGILDDRLEDQCGQSCRLQVGRNVEFDLQPLREAHHLDVEIELLERDFFGLLTDTGHFNRGPERLASMIMAGTPFLPNAARSSS